MHEHAKKILVVLLFLATLAQPASAIYGIKTTKTCATNGAGGTALGSAITSSTLTVRKGVEVENNGPNAIWCKGFNNVPALGDGRKISAGGTWAYDQTCGWNDTIAAIDTACTITCIAETAAQAANACTNLSEAF